uniref:Glutathione transferase n=1 Tax=Grammatophora oceanica TaxID=210454 RepID=A0A7S1YB30_9STRA
MLRLPLLIVLAKYFPIALCLLFCGRLSTSTQAKDLTVANRCSRIVMAEDPYAELWLCAIVTVLVYFLNARSGIAVGRARHKYNVPMPLSNGPSEFQRVFRAHANNAEQYPQFLALMWTTATVGGFPLVAGGLGVLWVVLRNLYVSQYHKAAKGVTAYSNPSYMVLGTYAILTLGSIVYRLLKSFVR